MGNRCPLPSFRLRGKSLAHIWTVYRSSRLLSSRGANIICTIGSESSSGTSRYESNYGGFAQTRNIKLVQVKQSFGKFPLFPPFGPIIALSKIADWKERRVCGPLPHTERNMRTSQPAASRIFTLSKPSCWPACLPCPSPGAGSFCCVPCSGSRSSAAETGSASRCRYTVVVRPPEKDTALLRNVQVSVCKHYHIDCVRHELQRGFPGHCDRFLRHQKIKVRQSVLIAAL